MSEEFIQTAFEPFTQERNDARTSYMGTGLGLAIVKQPASLRKSRPPETGIHRQ